MLNLKSCLNFGDVIATVIHDKAILKYIDPLAWRRSALCEWNSLVLIMTTFKLQMFLNFHLYRIQVVILTGTYWSVFGQWLHFLLKNTTCFCLQKAQNRLTLT